MLIFMYQLFISTCCNQQQNVMGLSVFHPDLYNWQYEDAKSLSSWPAPSHQPCSPQATDTQYQFRQMSAPLQESCSLVQWQVVLQCIPAVRRCLGRFQMSEGFDTPVEKRISKMTELTNESGRLDATDQSEARKLFYFSISPTWTFPSLAALWRHVCPMLSRALTLAPCFNMSSITS